ncbi:MAG: ribosomal protein S3, small subunit ribosomal protein S3 [Candidatus Moranbacteria bacterium GW2011_GWC1_45_18]|nr:MAG: 30S ribosomal protein S3 [Candidatus Moranbacteria bacterium GW2011_GWC2_40_12]KKT33873.1 MAG: 30S ribosomal protein S3 [Candidatus Moranbacteria bacterium GW2011_GWF2_44_10]KKT69649.1 MAG: 30S ribosomal protein S3 [Candidatus Moranbacteria bacterium GW2011_GWF1_44_4]KKT99773.1 MAG: ribosomal protein S3, small subunit ribosomal protein S3 [Candidatus Moranbacteria bacterium GW2011_GWC1_45_18]OGI23892.1 MAG: 30S ribosomal protein S3 [Candidatus Moranbacteria bacterium RIFOXYA1_FULL_44_8]
MGQKVNPKGLRIGITNTWKSRWISKKEYAKQLREDVEIRRMVEKKLRSAAVGSVEIERSSGVVRVVIKTARPGVIIGRGGSGIEDLRKIIKDDFFKTKKVDLKVEVEEIKNSEENAMVVAQNVAEQLEKRLPFRRVLKGVIDQAMEGRKIKGIKMEVAGRLGGSEIARREWLSKGTLPLHTLRADIDYAKATAQTTYGVIGVKVWIYRGEKFE